MLIAVAKECVVLLLTAALQPFILMTENMTRVSITISTDISSMNLEVN